MGVDQLPKSVQEVADVIGRDKALHLVANLPRCYAGVPGKRHNRVHCYVPKRITMDHILVQVLGFEDAAKMVKEFGGIYLYLANCSGNKGGRPKKNPAVEPKESETQNGPVIHKGVFTIMDMLMGGGAVRA